MNLESICAGVFSVSAMTITCQYVTCFIQRTGILRSHVCGSELCHEQGRLLRTSEKELMLLARKFYKTIFKEFGLYKSTVRQIVYKWRKFKTIYLPEKWSANKDHSKAEHVIVCEVAEVSRVTSK